MGCQIRVYTLGILYNGCIGPLAQQYMLDDNTRGRGIYKAVPQGTFCGVFRNQKNDILAESVRNI